MKLTFKEYLVNFGIGLLPEFGVAYLLMKLFDEGWDAFWILFFSIQALYLTVWLFRTVVSKLMFEIVNKSKCTDLYYEKLVQNKYPEPFDIYHEDIEHYFEEIISDESLKAETRISAASILTSLLQWRDGGQIQVFLRMRKCAKIAVKKYMRLNFGHETGQTTIEGDEKHKKSLLMLLIAPVIVAVLIFSLYQFSRQEFGWNLWEFLIGSFFLLGILGAILQGINWVRKKTTHAIERTEPQLFFKEVKKTTVEVLYQIVAPIVIAVLIGRQFGILYGILSWFLVLLLIGRVIVPLIEKKGKANVQDHSIHFRCRQCGTKYRTPVEKSGKKGTCKNCKSEIVVPELGSPLGDEVEYQ